MKIAIIGLGWYGTELAKTLSPKHRIFGTKSTVEGAGQYANYPFKTYFLDLNQEPNYHRLQPLFEVDAVVVNIPPPRNVDDGEAVYLAQMQKIARGITKYNAFQKLIFISSTGVFGESQTEVNEDTPPEPSREAGEILVAAESFFIEKFSNRTVIIRPGGLVGKDRHPAKHLAGKTNIAGRNEPVNLVYLDDLVELTRIVLESEMRRRIFHAVSSDHPTREKYYRYAAEKAGLPMPEFDQADKSQGKMILGEQTEKACKIHFRSPFEMI